MRILIFISMLPIISVLASDQSVKPAVELLNKAELVKMFKLNSASIFESSLKHETALFSWDKPNAEEIRKKNKALLAKRGKIRIPPKPGEKREELVRDRAIVHLSYSVQKDSTSAARIVHEAFRKDSDSLGKVNHGKIVSFRVNYDVPLKMGDRAAWSSSHRQLTVQRGTIILHLNVDIYPDAEEDFKHAKTLMEKILDQLPTS